MRKVLEKVYTLLRNRNVITLPPASTVNQLLGIYKTLQKALKIGLKVRAIFAILARLFVPRR